MHFFWPNLRCKVIEQMVKSRYLVEFPAQKKEPKWFQNLGHFKKNSSAQWPKKSPKNWTGPCLSLNMVRRNRFIKWQTPARNSKSSFEGANPTPPSPMQRRRPPARTTIESKRTVGGLGSEGDKTVIPGPKHWNPISSSKCIVPDHSAILEWQLKLILQYSNGKQEGAIPKLQAKHLAFRRRHPQTAGQTSWVKAASQNCLIGL